MTRGHPPPWDSLGWLLHATGTLAARPHAVPGTVCSVTERLDLVTPTPTFQIRKGSLEDAPGPAVSSGRGLYLLRRPQDAPMLSECGVGTPRSLPPKPTPLRREGWYVELWPAQAPGASVPCAFVSCDTIGGFLSL